MQVLFDAFKYTDEYYAKIEAGIANEEDCCLETDCYTDKLLVNLDTITFARPADDGKYTDIGFNNIVYTINVSFKDFMKIAPHVSYAYLKSRWAN